MKDSGGKILVDCLETLGVETVFGLCGHTVIAFMDAMADSSIHYITFRHEQFAAHAADGYFRATHKPGILMTHLGPGLTNAVTGVANAALDSSALVVIAGDIPTQHFGHDAHQEVKMHGDATQFEIYKPFVKRAWRVHRVEAIPDIVARAFNTAVSGRPGPVLIDIPMDLLSRRAEIQVDDTLMKRVFPVSRDRGDTRRIQEAAELLSGAASPAIYAGGGVILSGASGELTRLAETFGIPVVTSLMGKGAIREDHPLSMGMTGFWGTRLSNEVARNADVLLAVGTRFAEADCSSWIPEYTFAIPPTKLIHVDIDPGEIGKTYPTEVAIIGDARAVLGELFDALAERMPPKDWKKDARVSGLVKERQAWWEKVREEGRSERVPIHPARILSEVRDLLPEDGIVVTDVGWNKNGLGQQFPILTPQTHFPPSGLATMGFGPCAALGAKIGAPEKTVVALIGDGAMSSVLGVLATAREQNIPVTWIVMNNKAFGTIYGLQHAAYGRDFGTQFRDAKTGEEYTPDFAGIARSFGIRAERIEHPGKLRRALKDAFASEAPVLLDVLMDRDIPVPTDGYWDILDIYKY